MDLELGKELGAEEQSFTQRLTLYVPNKDKHDAVLEDHESWVTQARELLTKFGGGSTAYPPADGAWLTDEGAILWEMTRIIYCYVNPELFEAHVKDLREFLHRFGRETNQGEVVVEFEGRLYKIRTFDEPTEV